MNKHNLHQCPCEKACKCKMDKPCLECETYGTWLKGETIPPIYIKGGKEHQIDKAIDECREKRLPPVLVCGDLNMDDVHGLLKERNSEIGVLKYELRECEPPPIMPKQDNKEQHRQWRRAERLSRGRGPKRY